MGKPSETGHRSAHHARRAAARALLVAGGLVLAGAGAQAQEDCGRAAWPLAAERAALTGPSVREVASGTRLALPLDGAVALALAPQATANLPHAPDRAPEGGTAAGFLLLDVPAPERVWQITAAAAAWVDVFVDGRALKPVAFTGVHACPGVRKSLRFRIPPGAATLQVSGAEGARMGLIARPAE